MRDCFILRCRSAFTQCGSLAEGFEIVGADRRSDAAEILAIGTVDPARRKEFPGARLAAPVGPAENVRCFVVRTEIFGNAEIGQVCGRTLAAPGRVYQLVVCPGEDESLGLGQLLQAIDQELMPLMAGKHLLELLRGCQSQRQDPRCRFAENEIDGLQRALRLLGERDPEIFQFLGRSDDRVLTQIPDCQPGREDDHQYNRATEPEEAVVGSRLPLGACEEPYQPDFTVALTAAPIARAQRSSARYGE